MWLLIGALCSGVAKVQAKSFKIGVGDKVFFVPAKKASAVYKLDLKREFILEGAGTGLSLFSYYLENRGEDLTPAHFMGLTPEDVNGFDRIATRQYSPSIASISDYGLIAGTATSILTLTYYAGSQTKDLGVLAVLSSEVALVNLGLTYTVKELIARRRPVLYNVNLTEAEKLERGRSNLRSFYSGHTAHAFAMAALVGTVHGHLYPYSSYKPVVWGVGLAAASTIGFMRLKAGRHFPTDILAGAAMGTITGWAIPKLHFVKPPSSIPKFSLLPVYAPGNQMGLLLVGRF